MPQLLWLLLILSPVIVSHIALPLAAAIVSSPAPAPSSLPGCPSKCGEVGIPFPFGIRAECAWQGEGGGFMVRCDESSSPPTPRPYIGRNIEIKNISVETGEMYVYTSVAHRCFNSSVNDDVSNSPVDGWNVTEPLRISPTKNILTVIGCYTLALAEGISRVDGSSSYTGCISYCDEDFVHNKAKDGEQCTGLGCGQTTAIPANLTKISVTLKFFNNINVNNPAWPYSPCSYAFVAAKTWYNFKQQDLKFKVYSESFNSRFGESKVPFALDWAITKNGSCQDGGPQAPACVSANSKCVNTPELDGYLCNCTKGYQGNPYIPYGCRDIDECEGKPNPCAEGSTCKNTKGAYECKCNKLWQKGDGKSGEGCSGSFSAPAIAAVATVVSLLVLALLAVLVYYIRKERKQRQRRGFFDKNGGKLLEGVQINVYTEEQMKKITNHYSNSVGKGNFGNVFLGTIEDNQRVAVKCAIRGDGNKPPEGGDFVHEILFQFQMRHKNLVRLVGCCLETNLPMLVFEFVSSGSLFDVLHGTLKQRSVSMLERLDIAIGSAEALAYMHSHGHSKRIHGDVKSANILLDDNLSPKVSDFGSSKVVSSNTRYVSFVASDTNYVDPVYMKTGRFTEKSDVYSFGVVLMELITRKSVRYDGKNSLPIDFIKCFKVEGNGRKMYDQDILAADDGKSHLYMECLDVIGALAVRCLKEDMDERPDVAQVLEELNRVKKIFSRSDSYPVTGQSHGQHSSY